MIEKTKTNSLKTVEWRENKVIMIDQTKLPNKLEFVELIDYHQVADAIKNLVVRGAPVIGVSGAFGMALAVLQSNAQTKNDLIKDLEEAKNILIKTRPTAVNLMWALEKIMTVALKCSDVSEIKKLVIDTAKKWQMKMFKQT